MNDRDTKQMAFALDRQIRQEVTEKLIQAQLEEFEKNLRPRVKEIVEGLSIENVYRHHDMMTMRDMLHVTVRLKEER